MSNVIATNLIDRVSGVSTPMLNAVKGSAKALVNFDGTANPPTIRESFNVLGVTDNGTGDFTITFESNMPTANYSVAGFARAAGATSGFTVYGGGNFSHLTGSLRIQTATNDNADPTHCTIIII